MPRCGTCEADDSTRVFCKCIYTMPGENFRDERWAVSRKMTAGRFPMVHSCGRPLLLAQESARQLSSSRSRPA